MRHSLLSRRRGFTLLEMVIVCVMISLIALMSMSRMASMMNGWRVNRAAQAYGEELQSAFALVGRNRRPLTITLDTVAMELRITDRNGTVYRRRNFGMTSAYLLNGRNFTASRLTLEVFPPGLAADSMEVVITKQGQRRRIRLLRGGLVQVCSTLAPSTCSAS